MIRVVIVLVGGACWTSGVGDGEVLGVATEGRRMQWQWRRHERNDVVR